LSPREFDHLLGLPGGISHLCGIKKMRNNTNRRKVKGKGDPAMVFALQERMGGVQWRVAG
jgi:hypothetical protein